MRSAQINIQDNAYQGNLSSQNPSNNNSSGAENQNLGRRKNFFERKRFINYEDGKGGAQNAPDGAQGKQSSPPQDAKRGQNSNALHGRRRFDEL